MHVNAGAVHARPKSVYIYRGAVRDLQGKALSLSFLEEEYIRIYIYARPYDSAALLLVISSFPFYGSSLPPALLLLQSSSTPRSIAAAAAASLGSSAFDVVGFANTRECRTVNIFAEQRRAERTPAAARVKRSGKERRSLLYSPGFFFSLSLTSSFNSGFFCHGKSISSLKKRETQ